MLQTLNIPSTPLPEVSSAPPSAPPGAGGDAGERAEFAQLLQQARSADPEAARDDAGTVLSPKEARVDARARAGLTRATPEHKAHDTRHRPDAEPVEADVVDLAACIKQPALTEATSTTAEEASAAAAAQPVDAVVAMPTPDPVAPALPVVLPPSEPAPTLSSEAALGDDEPATRLPLRAARDLRLPMRGDTSASAATESQTAQATPAASDIVVPGKDAAFEQALRQAAGGRIAASPSHTAAPEATPAALPAFARELQQPLAHAELKAEAMLQAAPDEAGFAPALGAQVAVWVKDGVQEARLQLHPAELGPVTVQIALDGRAAHIDFTAAVAATRESIEQSLPALAAALRESGFTLAGGGVFGRSGQGAHDHPRERTPDGRGHRGTAAIGGSAGADAAPHVPRRWARSLVDVYA